MAATIDKPPASEPFLPGEVAYLRSGGPAMTVVTVNGENVQTNWICGITGMSLVGNFQRICLQHEKPK